MTPSNTDFAPAPEGFDPGNVRRLRATDVLKMTVETDPDITQAERDELAGRIRAIRNYFRVFAYVPSEGGNFASGGEPCLGCGERLGGMLGTFDYGIAHGEGHCSRCGYPCRADHYIRDPAGGETILTLRRYPLQYHPDELEPSRGEVE